MRIILCLAVLCLMAPSGGYAAEPMKALIVDGQNNHKVWPVTTQMMKGFLQETGLFQVDVATTAPKGVDPVFAPEFSDYDVVISNYNGAPWPKKTQMALERFVRQGGGLVIVHAADNSFSEWPQYNQMIGLGGWGGRDQRSGPYVYLNNDGKEVRDTAEGRGGHHGKQHEFSIVVRDPDHPITQGMPVEWMHTRDELYDSLRGPALNMDILATAYSDPATGGTGRHEPMIFVVSYGKGRVFHTPMGHAEYSQECVGFITTLQRGTEWAASGKVATPIPEDFPTAESTSSRTVSIEE